MKCHSHTRFMYDVDVRLRICLPIIKSYDKSVSKWEKKRISPAKSCERKSSVEEHKIIYICKKFSKFRCYFCLLRLNGYFGVKTKL